jgi:predicted RNA binding protein YcfA (HicA-like mRNA interferase family)
MMRRENSFRELERLLEWHGFELTRSRGSHHA